MTAPLRFLARETIDAHLPAGPIRDAALECRALVDATEAAAGRVFALGRPELDRQAQSEDAAAISAALAAPQWSDPGSPAADRLAADRKSAAAELSARQALSDRAVVRWSKSVARELGELTRADQEAIAKASPKIRAALEKLRPALADADERARRVRWLTWLATNRLDCAPPKRLSPESMPTSGDTFVDLLDRMAGLAEDR